MQKLAYQVFARLKGTLFYGVSYKNGAAYVRRNHLAFSLSRHCIVISSYMLYNEHKKAELTARRAPKLAAIADSLASSAGTTGSTAIDPTISIAQLLEFASERSFADPLPMDVLKEMDMENGTEVDTDEDTEGAERYTWEALTAKPDMAVTRVNEKMVFTNTPAMRKQVVEQAIKNAVSVGKINKNGNVVIKVKDTGREIILPIVKRRRLFMLEILFVSDYVCPYCLVAKEALRRALQEEGLQAHFTWQPFELTEAPRPRVDTYHDEVRRAHYQVLVEPCRQLGLDMKLPPQVVPRPYTQLAFEGLLYACDHGCGDAYNDLVYRAYFIEEQDIGDAAVLTDLARRLGLDDKDLANALAEGRYTAQEKAAVAYARDTLHTHGVPGIYLDGHKVEPAGYTVEDMRRLLQAHLRTAQAPASDEPTAAAESAPAFGCNESGCGIRPAASDDPAAADKTAPVFSCNESGCGIRPATSDDPAAKGESAPAFGCNENGCGARPAASDDPAAAAESTPTFGCNENGCG